MNIFYAPKISNTNFKSKNNIKVSVILPVYNQEKYLARALDSLRGQTLKETEFICVNDGSKDRSLNILQQYALKDKRIKIINQNNQGAGSARNNGLKKAAGEYIAFLDPDDWIEKNTLKTLYREAEKQNCDMLVFDFNRCDENGKCLNNIHIKDFLKNIYDIHENKLFNWKDIKSGVFGKLFPAAWNKFYKKDLIKNNKLYFAKSSLAEDMNFVFGATLKAKKIGYIEKPFYNYTLHNQSATRVVSNKNLCIFQAIDSVKKMIKKSGLTEDLKTEFNNFVLWLIIFHTKLIKSPDKLLDICKKRLTAKQNQMINTTLQKNFKVLSILEGLKNKRRVI